MNIRNFAIIAHVDHGKSTLADRFLELTGVVKVGQHEEQFLDKNPISRERGITIKLAPVRMEYLSKLKIEDSKYVLNLIDTPGHVDFSYEVDRTLACVEGVILLVDATAGVQAQTIANAYKAIEKNLVIVPAVNKIDLYNAEIKKTKEQLVDFLGIDPETSLRGREPSSSLEFKPIHSQALGAGFRVGFLGLLHADVVRERLEREFSLSAVLTPPQVEYKVQIENNLKGSKLKFEEPFVRLLIITPAEYLGRVMQLCQDYQGRFITMENIGKTDSRSLQLIYEMPMSELMADFYDNLKSVSSGYASLDWKFLEYRPVEADKLEILLNNQPVEEFSEIVEKKIAFEKAQFLVKRLREIIPRQQFEVKIQARFKGKIIASQRISPFRKDVTKKLYGGDRTRKDKLLDKQKEGKKRMKMIGRVEMPKEAFLKLFRK